LPHQELPHADKLGDYTTVQRLYSINRLGVMAQKAEKMFLKTII